MKLPAGGTLNLVDLLYVGVFIFINMRPGGEIYISAGRTNLFKNEWMIFAVAGVVVCSIVMLAGYLIPSIPATCYAILLPLHLSYGIL